MALTLGFGAFLAGLAGARTRIGFAGGVVVALAGMGFMAWNAVGRVALALQRVSPSWLFDFLRDERGGSAAVFVVLLAGLPFVVRRRRPVMAVFLCVFAAYGTAWLSYQVVFLTEPRMLTLSLAPLPIPD
jgi:hypothetical protein